MSDKDTQNCNSDYDKKDCISASVQNTIKYESETSTYDNINGDMQGSSTSPINADTLICQNCYVGFVLSVDLLSCISE